MLLGIGYVFIYTLINYCIFYLEGDYIKRTKETIKKIGELLVNLHNIIENSKGKVITIKESLTNNKDNYDRHFTSYSKFKLKIENCGLRFSGARFYVDGYDENLGKVFDDRTGIKIVDPSAYYEISADNLTDIIFTEEKVTLIEDLSDKWQRKTEILF